MNNSSKPPVKRFIAGAICPSCHLVDKTVIYRQDHMLYSECVSCGHLQQKDVFDILSIQSEEDLQARKAAERKVIWLKKPESDKKA